MRTLPSSIREQIQHASDLSAIKNMEEEKTKNMENPRKSAPSFETLPTELLLKIFEQRLTLEALIQLRMVSRNLRAVAWDVLRSERFWATSLAFDTNHARLGLEPVPSDDERHLWYKATDAVVSFVRKNIGTWDLLHARKQSPRKRAGNGR